MNCNIIIINNKHSLHNILRVEYEHSICNKGDVSLHTPVCYPMRQLRKTFIFAQTTIHKVQMYLSTTYSCIKVKDQLLHPYFIMLMTEPNWNKPYIYMYSYIRVVYRVRSSWDEFRLEQKGTLPLEIKYTPLHQDHKILHGYK